MLYTQAVGKQYFTNDENETLSLGRYCVTNLNLGYTFRTRAARSVRLGLQINNLFNAEYESNGYGYSYMDTWSEPTPRRHRHGLLLRAGAPERAGQRHGEVLTGKFRPPGTRSGWTQRR